MTDPSSSAAPPRFQGGPPGVLAGPPRAVPATTRLMVLTKGKALWIGALTAGALTFAVSSSIANSPARTVFFTCDDVPAVVTDVQQRTERGKRTTWQVYRATARAEVGGRTVQARDDLDVAVAVGDTIKMRVPRGRSDFAELFVGDAPPGRWDFLLTVWTPFAAIAVMLLQIARNRRDLRVLRHGEVTDGRLVHDEVRRTKSGVVHLLTFEYATKGGVARTTVKVPGDDRARLADAREPLVYDPAAPENGVLLDALPASVRVGPDGALSGASMVRPLLRVVAVLFGLFIGFVGLVLSGLLF